MPCARACHTAIALAGAVVSKPIAKKTTLFVGFAAAILQAVERRIDDAHVGPAGFHLNRSPCDPGTRSMSPNEQKITSGRRAMA